MDKQAGTAISCGHEPKTDEEKWNNPQDCWCEEHHMKCCRECIKDHMEHKHHKNHFTDEEWKAHVTSIKGHDTTFSEPTIAKIATLGITDADLKKEVARRVADQKRFRNEK